MRYRHVGSIDFSFSEVGFGCGGNAGLMVKGSFEEQRHAVARAWELGVNYFDIAPDYGAGAAERNLGRVLKELKFRPFVTSKVEIRAEDLGDIAGRIVRSTEDSLQRLGIDALDAIEIHNGPVAVRPLMEGRSYATLWLEDFMRPGGALDGIRRIVKSGKARHAGFVCRGNDGEEVRQLLATELFQLINLPYTLLNPTAGRPKPHGLELDRDFGDVIAAAQAVDVGVAVYSPLAGGALSDAGLAGQQTHPLARPKETGSPAWEALIRKAGTFQFLAQRTEMSLAQAAYRFVLTHPGVTTVLGGFSSIDQIDEIAAASASGGLDSDVMTEIERVWQSNFAN
ncbi:MAG: aldo/keto reductase [Proteobacteria bacterium]|nr:aldo/keto reductase [Pseudomonadota bacterium]MBI3498600.1 aldo/keto reductase [Pseudomonadota bacterium]